MLKEGKVPHYLDPFVIPVRFKPCVGGARRRSIVLRRYRPKEYLEFP